MLENNIHVKTNTPINDTTIGNKAKVKTEPVTPFDVIDPTKVTRPSKQDGSNQTNNQAADDNLKYNPDSVYEKFIKSLTNSLILSDSGKKILLNNKFINHNIKSDPILNALFEEFVQNIQMNDKQIIEFLKFQFNSYTKYNGEFFSELRNLYKNDSNQEEFKEVIRNFLRSYDCFTSLTETYSSINSSLKNIHDNLPHQLQKPFAEMLDKMVSENINGGMEKNLDILKNDILPFMGRYISKMNDLGPVRDYVSVLIHNIVRLETGSKENFSADLDNLFDFIKYNLNVPDDKLQTMKMNLVKNYEANSNIKNESMDSLFKLVEAGIKESENPVNKGVMEDITQSLLFSFNVNIPFVHIFLPLNYNGQFMFSELWIGKEDYTDTDKKSSTEKENKTGYKVFITFEIKNMGYFETVLVLRESKLSLEILVPSTIKSHADVIKNDLTEIISKNDITLADVKVEECMKKRRFNEVFKNFAERKNGVDVII